MTDKELLQLAAKAAGIVGVYVDNTYGIYMNEEPVHDSHQWLYWNPLKNTGNRYNLAKDLDIRLHFGPQYVTYNKQGICGVVRWPEDCVDDAYAIVMAAAEIGKGMV